jgi:hypothetical protein
MKVNADQEENAIEAADPVASVAVVAPVFRLFVLIRVAATVVTYLCPSTRSLPTSVKSGSPS